MGYIKIFQRFNMSEVKTKQNNVIYEITTHSSLWYLYNISVIEVISWIQSDNRWYF